MKTKEWWNTELEGIFPYKLGDGDGVGAGEACGVEIQQADELSENESPSLSGPAGYSWCKYIFRLCLF